MKIKISKHSSPKLVSRLKKKMRVRNRISGTSERPRLCIFRSARHIYAQIVDDSKGITLASASTLDMKKAGANREMAKLIGAEIAKRAQSKNIKAVVFDRSGYLYHGRIQALAEGAREGGLNF